MKIKFKEIKRLGDKIKHFTFESKRQKSWYISYLDKEALRKDFVEEGITLSDPLGEQLDSIKDETALVLKSNKKSKYHGRRKMNNYLILSGDWREQYSRCKTRRGCINLFNQNKREHLNFWSD